MTPELTAALARAKAVAQRALAHYGEHEQLLKGLEERYETAAAACRLMGYRRDSGDPMREERLRNALLDEIADSVVSGIMLWGVDEDCYPCSYEDTFEAMAQFFEVESDVPFRLCPAVAIFGPAPVAAAIDRKAAAMEARMDRIDAGKEKTDA